MKEVAKSKCILRRSGKALKVWEWRGKQAVD